MKTTKILKVNEFVRVCDKFTGQNQIYEVNGENISAKIYEPLYESETSMGKTNDNAFIALPECNVEVEKLTNSVTRLLKNQQIKGDYGFSIGHYFTGDYASGGCKWNEKSLCISLYGTINYREITITLAVTLIAELNIQRALVILSNDNNILEISKESSEVKPLPQNRIKRLND